ncbi:threonine/serine dehydratase [Nocardia barduliensis]|uniref:threonine/serine dehydratase n=1 Tax=Nocardia barduliensis TaxID=2736643 RepID=UPI001572705D|nr:threonine/serine dehydratase [Nocardia barduliensis]
MELTHSDVKAAAERIAGLVRPVAVARADQKGELWFALEFLQHTGSFKARGALNFLLTHRENGTLPPVGVTIASGGNAGLACAWAARSQGVPATVFLPTTAPRVKVDRLASYGADVRLVGTQYADALAASRDFAEATGALLSHAYDNPLIAAGAGTLMTEIHERIPDLDAVVVAVGGGGLFSGVATAAAGYGIRTVAVEPARCRALHAAIAAGEVVDVEVDSVAADSLGARRASELALTAARRYRVDSVLVEDAAIVAARRGLWAERRIAVEHAAATALAAVLGDEPAFRSAPGERVCVVLCGANTDPSDLAR